MATGISSLVSICIPTYNQTQYLSLLLSTIAEQTYSEYEIIISDDSDNNDVRELVNRLAIGEKLKYFHNKPSLGSPANWNAAIERATGEYIKIMHHDDAFASDDALMKMVQAIVSNNNDFVFADSKIENVKDSSRNRIHRITNLNQIRRKPYLLFFGNSIGGPSCMLIKKNLAYLHYDESLVWVVDMEYYIRLLKASSSGTNIPEPLIITHEAVEERLTSGILKDFELQIKEHAILYEMLAKRTPMITRFFMQAYLTRIFYSAKADNRQLTTNFSKTPRLLKIYFSFRRIKPLYFAYYLFIRLADLIRKKLY